MEGKKRERNSNFSREDTEILVTLVQKYKNIIENKKSDAATWQEKERAWKALEAEYNCSGAEIFRDAKHLKSKYEALKRDTRKKFRKSGGDFDKVPPLTPAEEKIKNIILSSAEGGESSCDFDQLDIGATDTQRELYDILECRVSADNSVKSMTDSDTADDPETTNTVLKQENQPPKLPMDYVDNPGPSASNWVDVEVVETPPKQWTEWNHSNVKSEQHPDMNEPKEKRPFNTSRLAEEKLELVQLQKTLVEEEVQEKRMKKQMMMMEMRHKKELHELEKEERLLKISILKCELENKDWY